MSNVDFFLKKTLGEDFFESLAKFELWKPGTKSVVDHEELRTALQIVPRTVIALLIRELSPMKIGDTKEIMLPVAENAKLRATKHERDVYSGEIEENNKKISEYKFRALPGVGLVIMSAFELYDMENLINSPSVVPDELEESKIQRLIDDRLSLHELIGKVVDKKIMEREAIHELVLAKLTEAIKMIHQEVKDIQKKSDKTHQLAGEALSMSMHNGDRLNNAEKKKRKRPLAEFLEKKKKAREFSVQMAKGETVSCPDCKKNIFDGTIFSGCICLGADMESKIFIKKSENGMKVRFGKKWDPENIEMLLEVLQKRSK